jgi:transcriptional regulator
MIDERLLITFFKRSCEAQKLSGKALARKQFYFGRMLEICALRNSGLTYKKIGEHFGISSTAISVVLHRAERWIKRQLRDEEQAKSVT